MDIVIAFKIDHDFPGPKMVTLPQIDDFSEYFRLRSPGTMDRSTRTVDETCFSKFDVSPLPFIEGIPTDSKVPTGFGYIMGHFLEVPENPQSPSLIPNWIVVYHKASPSLNALSLSDRAQGVNLVCQF